MWIFIYIINKIISSFQNPTNISYVFSGYAPLSVRLAEYLHQPGWRMIRDVLNLLPGPSVHEAQSLPQGLSKRSKALETLFKKF